MTLVAAAFVTRAYAGEAAAPSKWRTVCTLSGSDLSFADGRIESDGAPRDVESSHADRATVAIEVNGTHARVRAHVTAPFDFVVTTKNVASASLSLRVGIRLGGVVIAERSGVVRVADVTGSGRTLTVVAGDVSIGGLPLRCQDLEAVAARRSWMFEGLEHQVSGWRRIYATPGGAAFSIDAGNPLPVNVSAAGRGDWRQLTYFGYSDGGAGFQVSGWAQGLRVSEGSSMGGGALADMGFRSCAPRTPARMGFATLPTGTALFESSSGGAVWTTLTEPVRALVALYPRDRAAVAGLSGWRWPGWRCETAWVDPAGLVLETSRASSQPSAEAPSPRPVE